MGLSWFFSALADLSWKELLVFTSFTAGTCFFFHILTATKKEPDKLGEKVEATTLDKITLRLQNIIFFPFRLLWNLFVTVLLIKAFILWYGFLLGTVVAVILIFVFVPRDNWGFVIFGLPLLIPWSEMYTRMWTSEYDSDD